MTHAVTSRGWMTHAVTGGGSMTHAVTGGRQMTHAVTGRRWMTHAVTGRGWMTHAVTGGGWMTHAVTGGQWVSPCQSCSCPQWRMAPTWGGGFGHTSPWAACPSDTARRMSAISPPLKVHLNTLLQENYTWAHSRSGHNHTGDQSLLESVCMHMLKGLLDLQGQ